MKVLDTPLNRMNGTPVSSGKLRAVLVLVAALAAVLLAYWPTVASTVEIWRHSETYAHGFTVLPIVAWLVWRERAQLVQLPIQPEPRAIALIGVAALGWLLGELGSVNAASQAGLVLMIQAVTWAVLGTPLTRALLFPLGFLFFAVPLGEFMLPVLMHWTADFTVLALRASGIPVYREGLDFVIPSGNWSVVEACSGIRYLIASLMIGVLYAYLTYRSLIRRLLFIVAAILVPLIANWLRAYMIVMIGHLSKNEYATGVDHLIYGWVFFGAVTLLMFWIGGFWQEPHAEAGRMAPAQEPSASLGQIIGITALALAAVVPWRPLADKLETWNADQPVHLRPLAGTNGWQAEPGAPGSWRPLFHDPSALLEQTFRKDGAEVGLVVAFYRDQHQGRELISYENKLVASNDPLWRQIGGSEHEVSSRPGMRILSTQLRGGAERLRVWEWYWIGGRATIGRVEAKILQAKAKLLLQGDDAVGVVIFTREEAGREAERVLDAFVGAMGDQIQAMLAREADAGRQ